LYEWVNFYETIVSESWNEPNVSSSNLIETFTPTKGSLIFTAFEGGTFVKEFWIHVWTYIVFLIQI